MEREEQIPKPLNFKALDQERWIGDGGCVDGLEEMGGGGVEGSVDDGERHMVKHMPGGTWPEAHD